MEDYLASLPFEQAVPIPCSDDWAEAIAAISDREIGQRFPTSISPVEILRDFLD